MQKIGKQALFAELQVLCDIIVTFSIYHLTAKTSWLSLFSTDSFVLFVYIEINLMD